MTCHEAREQLSALLDGALTSEEQAGVVAHLEGCADCRREQDRLAATISLLHRVAPARAPLGFVDRVLEAAHPAPWHERLGRRLRWAWPMGLPLGAAAMLLVAGLAVYLAQRSPELQQATRTEAPAVPPAADPRRQDPSSPAAPAPPQPPRATVPAAAARPAPAQEPGAPGHAETLGKTEADASVAPREQKPAEPGATSQPEGARRDRAEVAGRQAVPTTAEPADAAAPRQKSLAARAPAALEAAAAPDIEGRLSVEDRPAAERALADLANRLGVSLLSRRDEAGETVVELAVTREAYPALIDGLGGIGRWAVDREPSPLPASLRVSVRLGG